MERFLVSSVVAWAEAKSELEAAWRLRCAKKVVIGHAPSEHCVSLSCKSCQMFCISELFEVSEIHSDTLCLLASQD